MATRTGENLLLQQPGFSGIARPPESTLTCSVEKTNIGETTETIKEKITAQDENNRKIEGIRNKPNLATRQWGIAVVVNKHRPNCGVGEIELAS